MPETRPTGAIGGPKWGVNLKVRPEQGLLTLRKALGLYGNIRPANFASNSLLANSPLKPSIAEGVDIIVVRELIGGAYFGPRKELGAGEGADADAAWDTMVYSVPEVQRITRVAAQIALQANPPLPIHSVDKANVLASSRLWRKVVTETLQAEYPQLVLDHQLVDSAAMIMVATPKKLNGVILTENLFGDMYDLSSSEYLGAELMSPYVVFPTSQVSFRDLLVSFPQHPSRARPPLPMLSHPTSSPRPVCTSLSTAQRPTSQAAGSPTPSAPSSAPRCSSATRSAAKSTRKRSRRPCARSSTNRLWAALGCAPPILVGPFRHRRWVIRSWRSSRVCCRAMFSRREGITKCIFKSQ